jgi:outer membrane immunogenic protein
MKNVLLSATALVALCTTAFAADLPTRAVAPVAPAPIFSWTGVYVGGTVGIMSLRTTSVSDFVFNTAGASNPNYAKNNEKSNGAGALIGGTIGYNYQFANNLVAGVEFDLSYSTSQNSFGKTGSTAYSGSSGSITRSTNGKSQISSFGTVRTRLGYAADRTLFFVTGGLAYGKVKGGYSTLYVDTYRGGTPTTSTETQSFNKMDYGWTVGAGVEHALSNNVTLKVEALYFDLGKVTTTFASNGPVYKASFKNDGVIGRVGVNYKF